MKPYNLYLFRLAAIMAVSVMVVGCTHTIKSNEISVSQAGSPMKAVRPKTFAFKEFKDIRGTDPFLVAKVGVHKFKLDQPAATVVATMIRKELQRNGHMCVIDLPQAKSDFIIEGTVYKCWFTTEQVGFFSKKVTANVAVKLAVSPVSPGKGVLTKSYEGEYHLAGVTVGMEKGKDILDQAILAMLKEMSTDPELIAFLEK